MQQGKERCSDERMHISSRVPHSRPCLLPKQPRSKLWAATPALSFRRQSVPDLGSCLCAADSC